jgi:hypothetical protein
MGTVSKHSFRTELGECDFHQQPHEAFAYSGISHLESGDVWNIIRPRYGLCSPGSCETCSAPSCRLTRSGTYIGRGTWLSIGSERKEYLVDYNLPYVDVCKDFIEFAIRESLRHNDTQALHILCRPWATDEQILANARREKLRIKQKRDKDVLMAYLERSSSSSARVKPVSPWNAGTMNSVSSSQPDGEMTLPFWVQQISEAPYVMCHRPGTSGMTLIRRNADPLVGQPHSTQHSYSAAGKKTVDLQSFRFRKRLEIRDGVSHLSIYLRGLLLDTVEVVGEVARNGQIPKEWADLGDWVNAKGPAPDKFWQTLVAGRGEKGVNPPAYYPRACSEAFCRGGFGSEALDTTGLINYEANSAVAQFCRRVRDVT